MVAYVDYGAEKVFQKFEVREVPWYGATRAVVVIQLVLICLSMTERPDFVGLTVIALAIYSVEFPETITHKTFRLLVLALASTFLYDIVWLAMLHGPETDAVDHLVAGTKQHYVAVFFLYFSFLFRVLVILVFWKDSIDFNRIMRVEAQLSQL